MAFIVDGQPERCCIELGSALQSGSKLLGRASSLGSARDFHGRQLASFSVFTFSSSVSRGRDGRVARFVWWIWSVG
jgi:hypothetical protein